MTNYEYPEAAEKLNLPVTWLRKHIKGLPHSKFGRLVRFSDDDLDAINAMHRATPEKAETPALALVREMALQRRADNPRRKRTA